MIGMLGGLTAAVGQSLSYLGTRHYVQQRPPGASRELLVFGHLWMGILGLLTLPFCIPAAGIPWKVVAIWTPINVFLYSAGQTFQTHALKHAEASRISPLMTIKVVFASLIVLTYGKLTGNASFWITPLQWAGIILCTFAGISIGYTGGMMRKRAIGFALLTAFVFAVSDWSITRALDAYLEVDGVTSMQARLLTQAFTYIGTGLVALPLMSWAGRPKPKDMADAFPFAACWFVAMLGLFWGFATVGILLSIILQCTRGFVTILIGALLMKLGHHHIEPHAPRRVVIRRLVAGFLMFLGISMYVLKEPATFHTLFQGPTPAAATSPR